MEEKTQKALTILAALSEIEEQDYATLLKEKLGVELLSVFDQYCRELLPSEDETAIDTLIHLMITGYLIHQNEEKPLLQSNIVMPS